MTLKWIIGLGLLVLASQVSAEETHVFRSQMDKVNYGIGVEVARKFKSQGVEVDLEFLVKGLKDALSGEVRIPDKELSRIMTAFQTELRQKHATAKRFSALDNRKKGEAFLAGNKIKEGVVTLPSGLQYKILKEAQGKKPTDADKVECSFRGTLIDGTEFDSNLEAEKRLPLKVSEVVVPGWREAFKLMPVGSRWQLFIPSQLAYGERGSAPAIGPNQTLILEVELLAIK